MLHPPLVCVSVLPSCAVYGLCRIIPPAGWSPPFCLDSSRFKFSTRVQDIHALQSGRPFVQKDSTYTLRQFQVMAETFKAAFIRQLHRANSGTVATAGTTSTATVSSEKVEAAYWDIVNQASSPQPSPASPAFSSSSVQVEYGADLDSSMHGSGFESLQLRGDEVVNDNSQLYAGSIGWNLRALPLLSGSLLGLLDEHVPGVCQQPFHAHITFTQTYPFLPVADGILSS